MACLVYITCTVTTLAFLSTLVGAAGSNIVSVLSGESNVTLKASVTFKNEACQWIHLKNADEVIVMNRKSIPNVEYNATRCIDCTPMQACPDCDTCVTFHNVTKELLNGEYRIDNIKTLKPLEVITLNVYENTDLQFNVSTNASNSDHKSFVRNTSKNSTWPDPVTVTNVTGAVEIKLTLASSVNLSPRLTIQREDPPGDDVLNLNVTCDQGLCVAVVTEDKYKDRNQIYVHLDVQGVEDKILAVRFVPEPNYGSSTSGQTEKKSLILVYVLVPIAAVLIVVVLVIMVKWVKKKLKPKKNKEPEDNEMPLRNGDPREQDDNHRPISQTDGPSPEPEGPDSIEQDEAHLRLSSHSEGPSQVPQDSKKINFDKSFDHIVSMCVELLQHVPMDHVRSHILQNVTSKENDYKMYYGSQPNACPFRAGLRLAIVYEVCGIREMQQHDEHNQSSTESFSVLQHFATDFNGWDKDENCKTFLEATKDQTESSELCRGLLEYLKRKEQRDMGPLIAYTVWWWDVAFRSHRIGYVIPRDDFSWCHRPLVLDEEKRILLSNEEELTRHLCDKPAPELWMKHFVLPYWQSDPMFVRALVKAICRQCNGRQSLRSFKDVLGQYLRDKETRVQALFAIQQFSFTEGSATSTHGTSDILKEFLELELVTESDVKNWVLDPRQKTSHEARKIALNYVNNNDRDLADINEGDESSPDVIRKIQNLCQRIEVERDFYYSSFGEFQKYKGALRDIVMTVCHEMPSSALDLLHPEGTIWTKGQQLEVLDGIQSIQPGEEGSGTVIKLLKEILSSQVVKWESFVLWMNQGRDGRNESGVELGKAVLEDELYNELYVPHIERMQCFTSTDDNMNIIDYINKNIPQDWFSQESFLKAFAKITMGGCAFKDGQPNLLNLYKRIPLFWHFLRHHDKLENEALKIFDRTHDLCRNPCNLSLFQTLLWGNAVSVQSVKKYAYEQGELNASNSPFKKNPYRYKNLNEYMKHKLKIE